MAQWNEDLISIDIAGTLDGMFRQRVKRSPDRLAYRHYDKDSKSWLDLNWSEAAAEVARWQDALAGEDLKPGDRVALVLRNCVEWMAFDQAALGLGLVVVPLYTDDRAENVAYILRDAAVKLLLVQGAGRWRRLLPALEGNEILQRVVVMESGADADQLAGEDERVIVASNWLPKTGGKLCKRQGDPHELASIVYTSGTTGRPKGVMLSHHNIMSVAHAGVIEIDIYKEDLFLSFLPLSHTLERTGGYYLPIMTGAAVAFARSVGQLADDLIQIRPTAMIAVPRIFERIYGRLDDKMAKQSALVRGLFHMAVEVGWSRFQHQQGRGSWKPSHLLWPLLDRLVARKISDRLGGRLRVAVSGGAPLSPDIAKVFVGLGIPLIQGYGLTETSPVISVNTLKNNIPASVGVPLRNITVKIGENDELLVKSPGVMLGYWNNHAATVGMIDSDGWLHTGDQARIDEGHIFITGRIKDILILSNGEKIPPADMELAIALDPLFDQVMVVGEGRAFLSVLLVLNADLWPSLASEYGLDPDSAESLADSRLISAALKRVKLRLNDFPGFAKIRRATLTLEPWSVDNGLMTPTMKIKRAKVLEVFSEEVERMYL